MNRTDGERDEWPDPVGPKAPRSVLAQDLTVEGDITSAGPLEVLGSVLGTMRAPEIVIATTGRLEGSVNSHNLSVLGMISGEISARHVRLAQSATVRADVLHEQIAIEAGAELEGRLQRKA